MILRAGHTEHAAVADAVEIASPAQRVQLFPYGTWTGRNGQGPYSIADRAHAERIIAATAAAQGPVDLMFDYDHQAVRAPAVAGQAKAAGWIKQLHAADDGLWADVEWTPAAAAAIEAREYRYTSPYFLHDRKTGAVTRIINAGLTNTPNFNLAAVAASALNEEQAHMNELLMAIAKALGLGEDATQEMVMAEIAKLTGATVAMASAASALGLAAGADGAAIASAITTLKDKAVDTSRFVPIEQLQAVNARLVVIEGDKHAEAVASAIAAGKLAPASKDWALDPNNRAAVASFLATAPVVLNPGASTLANVDLKSDVVTDEEMAIASSLGLTKDQYLTARKEDA
ncbi:phage protease [Sphingomonas sp. TX0522]|uniref:phage protease n=1 Tax=Sphingomonas sp. TX0522 TaxID=2479205 RepID=UPI0018DFF894|nr:phage protease [Sphingomonas sp. TX0522]MBI0530085.1 hypothetical protein [Sphingomonas sp. TX0522]